MPKICLPFLFLFYFRYLQNHFFCFFITIFLAFNQEVYDILNGIIEISFYHTFQIVSAIFIPLYYGEIYKTETFSPMIEIAFLFKEFYKSCHRCPTWTRLIVQVKEFSNRKTPSFPKEVHHFFLSFCKRFHIFHYYGLIKLDNLSAQI